MTRPILLTTVVASVFVAGVIAVRPGRRRVRNAVALAVMQVILTGLAVALNENSSAYLLAVGLGLGMTAVLIVFSLYCVVDYVLQAATITRDQIYAGICAYLMFGFAFGAVYYLLNILEPASFAVNTSASASAPPDLMYFSFVTLATLGYGDVTPVARASRALAELEALSGMLYIAVFMARLVSLRSVGDVVPGPSVPNKPSDIPLPESKRQEPV